MKTWTCQREGSCCTKPVAVVMTTAEQEALMSHPAAAGKTIQFEAHPEGVWVAMKAGPCPFYDKPNGACSVYESRPYNCRRFQCGRWDTSQEAFPVDPMRIIRSDNDLRWSYAKNQAAHHAWAVEHGWSPDL